MRRYLFPIALAILLCAAMGIRCDSGGRRWTDAPLFQCRLRDQLRE
jgi:hypothetical protein